MKFLLDTDICIYLINQKIPVLREKINRLSPGDLALSAISYFELQYGMRRSRFPQRNEDALRTFLAPMTLLPFESGDAEWSGNLRAELEAGGNPIGPYDLLIAAQAMRHSLTLVSNNIREFGKVKGLKLENWAEG